MEFDPARLAYLRTRRDLSQTELARLAKVSVAMVHRLESGARTPSMTTLKKLAHALRCDPAALMSPIAEKVSA